MQPVKQSFISILQRLENFPLSDVVRLHSALDNLIFRFLRNAMHKMNFLGCVSKENILSFSEIFVLPHKNIIINILSDLFSSCCPTFSILCHNHLSLLSLVQTINRSLLSQKQNSKLLIKGFLKDEETIYIIIMIEFYD